MKKVGCGNKLKMLRKENELTLEMLALDINNKFADELDDPINKGMVSRWENNRHDPSLSQAIILCKYFNVSMDYLMGLTDVRTPSHLLTHKKGTNK